MKVTKTETDGFKPFNLTIEVSNEDEYNAIRALFGLDSTVPNIVRENSQIGKDGERILGRLFHTVYHAI